MAFEFVGDSDLSVPQKQFLSELLQKYGFDKNKILIETVGKSGDNYISNVKRVIVERNSNKSTKFIIKIAPTNDFTRDLTAANAIFQNEQIIYEELLPIFHKMQIEARVPKEELIKFAKFHGAYLKAPHEIIILEDLQESGYVMLDRLKFITNDTVKLILEDFATFHSMSYVLKHKQLKIFENLKSRLFNFLAHTYKKDFWKKVLIILENDVINVFESNKYKNVIKGSLTDMYEKLMEVHASENTKAFSIIEQGDAWTNNILFKIKEEKPMECILIDYQLSKESVPVSDLLYMIFNCTDYATRQKHYHEWINYYYSQLDKSLNYFKLKANDVYPRYRLEIDLKRYAKAFLGIIIIISSFILRTPEEAKAATAIKSDDIDDIVQNFRVTTLSAESIALFKAKIGGLIDSYYDFGYL